MKRSALARWLLVSLLLLQLILLAGCGAQQEGGLATPVPAIKAVQATSVPTTALSSASPTDTAFIPAPYPTKGNPTTAAEVATKLAENPMPTFGPAPTPSRDVAWLVDLLQASQAMTITAYDNPDLQVSVDQADRKELADLAQTSTIATVMGDEWLGQYCPFPGYGLQVKTPSYSMLRVVWASRTHVLVSWLKEPWDDNVRVAYYIQQNSALWNAVSEMAPVAHYPESSVRHLLDASAIKLKIDGYDYAATGESPRTINAARVLASGTLTKGPPPNGEPVFTIYFTVNAVVYEVKVWNDYFTYNGNTYQLKDAGPGVRGVINAG